MTFDEWMHEHYPAGLKSNSNKSIRLAMKRAFEAGVGIGEQADYAPNDESYQDGRSDGWYDGYDDGYRDGKAEDNDDI
jgi:hypothetical protein